MARNYPRFLFSDPKNTKSEGPFLVHCIYPRMIFKIDKINDKNSFELKLIEQWDETPEPFSDAFLKAENAVAWFAAEWLNRQILTGVINLNPTPYQVSFKMPLAVECLQQEKNMSYISTEELDNLKRAAHNALPSDCVLGFGEAKFCHHRNGDGNMCKHCSDYA